MERVKVDIFNGVYLDKLANYFVIELGVTENEAGEVHEAVRVTGFNSNDEERSDIVIVSDMEQAVGLAKIICSSEYLGEL